MQYIVTHRIDCALIISNGVQLEIDGFIFIRNTDGNNSAQHIQTEVEAHTIEEAQRNARKRIIQFLSKISIFHNSNYMLLGVVSVSDGTRTTVNQAIMGRAHIGVDGNLIKDEYMRIKNKRIRIRPLQHYSDAINTTDPFDQFRKYYLVLENYLKETFEITKWIQQKLPTIEMKDDIYGHKKNITIISWIRHRLSHASSSRTKKTKKGSNPLMISNPEHVLLVQKHLPIIQNLAREIIREYEKI